MTDLIVPDRLTDLEALHLDVGGHARFTDGHCAMEVAAWLAGEPHSDRPTCVSPPLRSLLIGLNDTWPDAQRQLLVPFLPRIIGTAGDGQDEARSYLALDWLIRTYTPAWLDLAGLSAEAQSLRGLRRIVDLAAAHAAGPVVRNAQVAAAASWDVAWDAARARAAGAAAWAAARDAAGDAARAAAGVAAGDAARAAAGSAAGAAAWDAARFRAAGDAARAAARSAAGVALRPTVEQLQTSALNLLATMVNPAEMYQEKDEALT